MNELQSDHDRCCIQLSFETQERNRICKTLGGSHEEIPEEKLKRKKSQFYSELMLDNRFASLDNNKWDLRNRRKYDEVHVNTSEIEIDDEENDELLDDSGLDIPSGDDAY